MTPPLLEVRDLRVIHRGRGQPVVALDGISFQLPEGRTLGVVGESGSGKSTLARTLVGLCRPSGGEIRLEGHRLRKELARPGSLADKIQLVFQDARGALDPRLRIEDSLALVPTRGARWKRESRDRLRSRLLAGLDEVELSAPILERRPSELSGGERQRVTIARALLLEPKILILDEALASLDLSLRAQILNLLTDLQSRRKLAIILISHERPLVEALSDDLLHCPSRSEPFSG